MAFRILLIERDEGVRTNWNEFLRICKYQVTHVSNLNLLRDLDYDAIIAGTDIVGLDGLALKSLLHNDERRIPIIFTSTEKVPNVILDRDEIAGIAFLRKPFGNSLLLEHADKARKYKALIESNADASKAIARLLIHQPGQTSIELILIRSYTFGRYRESDEVRADVRLASAAASRKHAFLVRIYRESESYYKLIDFSANGTLINGKKIQGGVQVLKNGDTIEFYPGCKATYEAIDREAIDLDVTLTQSNE